MKNKKQTAPSFIEIIHEKGEMVYSTNSGESCVLSSVELSVYDYILGVQYVMKVAPHTLTQQNINNFSEALDWFLKNNAKAYKILLSSLDNYMDGKKVDK